MKKLITIFPVLVTSVCFGQVFTTGSPASGQVAYFSGTNTITGNNTLFTNGNSLGVGTNALAFKLNVTTASLNDGLRILQTGASAATFRLDNSSAGGRSWGILSTSNGNSQLGGKLLFYDYSGGGERMLLDGNGNLGLGVFGSANASAKLHLKTSTANDGMRIEQNGSGNAVLGLYNTTAGATNWSLQSTGNGFAQGSGNFMLKNEVANRIDFWIAGATGNVGIGTTNPTGGRLHIYTNNGSGLCVEHNVGYDYDFGVKVKVNRDLTKAFSVINTTSGTEVMTIWGTGVINTPKLYAQEVQVVPVAGNNPWPDFVFAPTYNLTPLSQVETFYQANNHLPGVPDACEVEQNGINVWQMNAILLQKVEELTLYLVDQQKQIDALKAADQKTH